MRRSRLKAHAPITFKSKAKRTKRIGDRRLPIYALLSVPEVWRYDGYSLEFLALVNGEYQPIEMSLSFPDLPAAIIVEYVQKRLVLGESATLREFRKWIQANVVAA